MQTRMLLGTQHSPSSDGRIFLSSLRTLEGYQRGFAGRPMKSQLERGTGKEGPARVRVS